MKLSEQKCIRCDGIFPPHEVICHYCYDRIDKTDPRVAQLETENARLREQKEMHSYLREVHKGWRRNLQRHVDGLRGYKQQVDEVAELMYQHTMKRLQGGE